MNSARWVLLSLALAACLPFAARAEDESKPKSVNYQAELNDRLGKGITAEKNACVLLWKAFGPLPESSVPAAIFKRLGIQAPPKEGNYFIGIHRFLIDRLQLDRSEFEGVYHQMHWAAKRPWAAKDYPLIGVWLKENEKPLAVVREATKRPDYYNPLIADKGETASGLLVGVPLPIVWKNREITSALCARAMLRLNEGQSDEAWADLLACHRLARLAARGGTLIEAWGSDIIESIVSEAELAYLDRAKLTSKQILERLKDLQGLPRMPAIADALDLGERYVFMDALDLYRRGGWIDENRNVIDNANRSPEELKALESIDWKSVRQSGNLWYDRMIAALRLPNRVERCDKLAIIEERLKALKSGTLDDGGNSPEDRQLGEILSALLLPIVRNSQNRRERVGQVHANVQLAFALAAYQRDRGRYPAKLDDLSPKYFGVIPNDAFSGKPLTYRPAEKGYLLYSVGINGKDDGGRWYDDDPPGDDPRVQMPLPPIQKE